MEPAGSNPDLRHAMAALSQLSYGPKRASSLALKLEVVRPVDPDALVVATRCKPKLQLQVSVEALGGHEEAAVDLLRNTQQSRRPRTIRNPADEGLRAHAGPSSSESRQHHRAAAPTYIAYAKG